MSWTRAFLIVIWAGTLVSGCASYKPAPISAAENAHALDSRSLSDPRLRQFVALVGRPDADSDRPLTWDLTTLTAAALYYHPDIALAKAKLAVAEAAVITAGQRPNPVLNVTNIVGQGLVAGAIPAGAAPLTVGPAIDFILESFGKRENRTAQAQRLADAARFDIASAGWQVRGRVRAALLALWASQQRLTLTRRRLALEDQLVKLLEQRLVAGEAAALDVSRERVNRSEITLAVDDLDQAVAQARVQLATAIGVPARALDGLNVNVTVFDHPPAIAHGGDSASWRREALTQRADVQAGLENYEAAQAALRLSFADQYPNVSLSPGYSYQYGINQYQLNLTTTLPIFNQNQGPIAEALAKRRQAAAAFTAVQAQVIGAIDEASTAYRKATQTLTSADALISDEKTHEQETERAFRAGQVDRPALVTAQLEAATIDLSTFDTLLRQREAIGSLEDALQRPLYGPDLMLNVHEAPIAPAESAT